MGLLDELEAEAARRRGEGLDAEAQREARDVVWREQLRPAMEQLSGYLKKLSENLAFLDRRIRVSYQLPGYGEVVAYADGPFDCRITPAKHQFEIVFECIAQVAPDESAVTQADNATKVRLINGVLQQHRLSGMQDTAKNANGEVTTARFQARGRIPLTLEVVASRDSGVARMQFVNFEAFGSSARNFPPEQMNETLFDQVGRYLTREETSFARENVGDDLRRKLQNQVQRDQVRREWEQHLSRQLQEDEVRVLSLMSYGASPGAFLGRLRLMLRRLFRAGERAG